MNAVSANRLELIQIADAVAREKSIDRSLVIEAMEDALARAARSRYGHETNVKAEINPKTGETRLWRLLEVVEQVEDDNTHISLKEALHRNPAAKIGDFISEPLPPFDYGRVSAMAASRSSLRKCARPNATVSTKTSRIVWARSSTASSSASNTGM